jgi:hypothetical protein
MLTQDLLVLTKKSVEETVKIPSGLRFTEIVELVRKKYEGFAIAEWLPAES